MQTTPFSGVVCCFHFADFTFHSHHFRQFSFKTVLVGRIIRSTNNRHLPFDAARSTRTVIIN